MSVCLHLEFMPISGLFAQTLRPLRPAFAGATARDRCAAQPNIMIFTQ